MAKKGVQKDLKAYKKNLSKFPNSTTDQSNKSSTNQAQFFLPTNYLTQGTFTFDMERAPLCPRLVEVQFLLFVEIFGYFT